MFVLYNIKENLHRLQLHVLYTQLTAANKWYNIISIMLTTFQRITITPDTRLPTNTVFTQRQDKVFPLNFMLKWGYLNYA
jgi:hypothetical protein